MDSRSRSYDYIQLLKMFCNNVSRTKVLFYYFQNCIKLFSNQIIFRVGYSILYLVFKNISYDIAANLGELWGLVWKEKKYIFPSIYLGRRAVPLTQDRRKSESQMWLALSSPIIAVISNVEWRGPLGNLIDLLFTLQIIHNRTNYKCLFYRICG